MTEATRIYPADRRTPPALSAMGLAAQALPAQVTARLTRLSRVESVDVATVMLAAWGLLLGAGRAGPGIRFSYLVCNRPPAAGHGSPRAGLYVDPPPLRRRIAGDLRLNAWLKEIQRHQVAHETHGPMTLTSLRPGSGTRGAPPLCHSLVLVQGVEPCPALTPIGWHSSPDAAIHDSFPLTLTVFLGEYLGLELRYRRTDFSAEAAEALLGRLGRVLTGFARGGMQRLVSIASQAGMDEWEQASTASGPVMPDFKPLPSRAGHLSL